MKKYVFNANCRVLEASFEFDSPGGTVSGMVGDEPIKEGRIIRKWTSEKEKPWHCMEFQFVIVTTLYVGWVSARDQGFPSDFRVLSGYRSHYNGHQLPWYATLVKE